MVNFHLAMKLCCFKTTISWPSFQPKEQMKFQKKSKATKRKEMQPPSQPTTKSSILYCYTPGKSK